MPMTEVDKKVSDDGRQLALTDDTSIDARVKRALQDGPLVYANGFITAQTSGDIMLILERNQQPACVLNLSFTMAKSIAQGLGAVISKLEADAGREIMTTQQIDQYNAATKK